MTEDQGKQPVPIYTIGYGSHAIEDFVAMLQQHGIKFLIDVRSQPYSRFKPEFSKEALDKALRSRGIRYVFMGDALGGRPSDETCYTDGKVDYAKCREKPWFQQGIMRLRNAWDQRKRVALMCSEGKPEECHRSKLIGVSLVDAGIEVLHIDETGQLKNQQDVINLLTGGQLNLFGDPPEVSTSRKKYRAGEGEDQHGQQT